MESAGLGVKLDSSDAEAALCSITVAELAHGIYRANTSERRERRRTFLDELKAAVPVYPITDVTAELVGSWRRLKPRTGQITNNQTGHPG